MEMDDRLERWLRRLRHYRKDAGLLRCAKVLERYAWSVWWPSAKRENYREAIARMRAFELAMGRFEHVALDRMRDRRLRRYSTARDLLEEAFRALEREETLERAS